MSDRWRELIEAIHLHAEAGRRTSDLIESRALPLLERIARALEGGVTPEAAPAARHSAEELRARIDAALHANDPDGAMDWRDELAIQLEGEALAEVDGPLVKWLMTAIQKRLRGGTIRADLVDLIARVADRFGGTPEGASLRASLPTLRRSAGQCPRCAGPYTGLGDACPKCTTAPEPEFPDPVPVVPPDDESAIEFDEEPESSNGHLDLNNDRFWKIP